MHPLFSKAKRILKGYGNPGPGDRQPNAKLRKLRVSKFSKFAVNLPGGAKFTVILQLCNLQNKKKKEQKHKKKPALSPPDLAYVWNKRQEG